MGKKFSDACISDFGKELDESDVESYFSLRKAVRDVVFIHRAGYTDFAVRQLPIEVDCLSGWREAGVPDMASVEWLKEPLAGCLASLTPVDYS